MFDEAFFQTRLPAHIKAKTVEGTDQPAVHVTLRSGQVYKIGRVLEVSPQWVMFEVYPPDGKSPRPSTAQTQQVGGSQYDLDRMALAYEYIVLVTVTLESKQRDLGFRA